MEAETKTYALVKRSICVNTILADEAFIATIQGYDAIIDCSALATYGIGQFWTGTEFISMEEAIARGLV